MARESGARGGGGSAAGLGGGVAAALLLFLALPAGALLLCRVRWLRCAGRAWGRAQVRGAGCPAASGLTRVLAVQGEEARRGGPSAGRGAPGLPQPGVRRSELGGAGEQVGGGGPTRRWTRRQTPPDSAPLQTPTPQADARSTSLSYFVNPLFAEAEA